MKLSDLLSSHPEVKLARPQDNGAILKFFDTFPMKGKGLQLLYERFPDFFTFLSYQSSSSFVFLLVRQNEIQGVGTLVVRKGFIRGEEKVVGYLGDLRVKAGKKNALVWRKFYQDLITHSSLIEEFQGVEYFVTAMIDSNAMGRMALVQTKKNSFHYHLLTPYKMVNIYAKRPWKNISHQYEIRLGREEDFPLIMNYWKEQEQKKEFGIPELPSFALENWDDFHINKMVLAFKENKIVGMCGLWSPHKGKRIILKKIPPGLKLLTFFIRWFKTFPMEGEELRPLYLTLLNYNDTSVLSDLLIFIHNLEIRKKYHVLSFASFPAPEMEKVLKPFFCEQVAMGLYQVYPESKPHLKLSGPKVGFEMALV